MKGRSLYLKEKIKTAKTEVQTTFSRNRTYGFSIHSGSVISVVMFFDMIQR